MAAIFKENFYLKGGALLYAFNQEKARPTKDIDFLGTHISNDRDYIKAVFSKISQVACEEDGMTYDADTIEVIDITQEKKYHGARLSMTAHLDTIRQQISMDIGFGNVVTAGPQNLSYPLLLENVPNVNILAYSLETVVAEKGAEVNESGGGNGSSHSASVKSGKCKDCAGNGKCSGGTKPSSRYHCHGSKKCGWCNGDGFNYTAGNPVKCSRCKGKKECTYCNGSGKCTTCRGSGKG